MREADGVVQIPGQRRVNRGGDGGDEQHQQVDRRGELVVEVGGDKFKHRHQNQRFFQRMHHFDRADPHRAQRNRGADDTHRHDQSGDDQRPFRAGAVYEPRHQA